jgi:fibronectin-binding autotransporter adhesin
MEIAETFEERIFLVSFEIKMTAACFKTGCDGEAQEAARTVIPVSVSIPHQGDMRTMIKQALLRSTMAATSLGLALPGGAGAANALILEAGSVSPSIASPLDTTVNGSVTVGDTAVGSATVNGGSTLTVNQIVTPTSTFDGARIHVGNGGAGTFTIDNGTVNINAGAGRADGARLQVSNVPGIDAPASSGNVQMTNGAALNINGIESAGINVGRDGLGVMGVAGSTIDIDSANGSASITVGGDSNSGVPMTPQPDTEGHMTLNNAIVTIDSGSTFGNSAAIIVGRTPNTTGPLVTNTLDITNGRSITMDGTGNGSTVLNVAENDANGSVVISGGSTVKLNNTGSGNALVQVGRSGSGTGTLTVTGATTSLTTDNFVTVGQQGATGVMTVQDNAVVNNSANQGLTRIGRDGGTGTLNVDTGGVYNATTLQTGRDDTAPGGSGTLNVAAGGTVNVNALQNGRDAGTTGVVNVTGNGVDPAGALNVTDTIITGLSGNGTMNIGQNPLLPGAAFGGLVAAHSATVGHVNGVDGTVNINNGGLLALTGLVGDPDGA